MGFSVKAVVFGFAGVLAVGGMAMISTGNVANSTSLVGSGWTLVGLGIGIYILNFAGRMIRILA